ncbi:pyridoxal phosphate-dependent aminotransferase [Rossellomorea vietnamensis]|uniref:pyridoxal phosphate-dependent aminotransferase n=1 Tax=Rossellomorea vietnamensis TaxID=218284 RepID=UPI00077CAA3E|nr:pyridoxal phosphate-dependent aminotransferase [Rossellomorea vietnamensis]OXS55684.1 LL-diaminopimelate aminotransferase [Bacillus sp. DSM 27956]PRX71162.1 aminotransferase [Bacillus sp. V-88]SLK24500.1 aminotransferase [Bacillus sp. V-88]
MKHFEKAKRLESLPEQFFASLAGTVNAVVNEGHDVINLGQGNPDQPTPPHIVGKLTEAAKSPSNHKYPPFRGLSTFKEAIAAFYLREYGVEIDPETEVAVLFGGKAGLVEIPQCLLNPGDGVFVPDPGYPDYVSGVALAEASMIKMPLKEENGFLPDYRVHSPEEWERAKLMFLNYPNNPTGATATKSFFDDTVELASKHDICVVHDFAYGAIGFDGQKPLSFLETDGAKDVGIEIYTLSKTFNMAGWRVGFAVGNKSVIEAINLLQDHLYVSLFGAIQEAATTALLSSQDCVTELVATYEERRQLLISGLQGIGWDVKAPQGSFFAWLKVPEGFTSVEFSTYLLEKIKVAVAPGVGFGEYGEGYVRVGLLTTNERIKEAISRIESLELFHKRD